jgi:hypothetical protein
VRARRPVKGTGMPDIIQALETPPDEALAARIARAEARLRQRVRHLSRTAAPAMCLWKAWQERTDSAAGVCEVRQHT